MGVITSKNKNQVVVEKTGHGAAFRKVRCPKCRQGYAVQSNSNPKSFHCQRCGADFELGKL